MFATSAELDDGALAELREFTVGFERRLAEAPPTESVPSAASCAAAYQGRGTMPCTQTRGRRRTLRGRRNKQSTSALKTKATAKQEENGSPLTNSNRRPPPYHGESARPQETAQMPIPWRFPTGQAISRPWWIESRPAPSRLARPETCPHDLSPKQHPRRRRAGAARRLRGRRIRSPREVERFLDRERAADLGRAGDLVG